MRTIRTLALTALVAGLAALPATADVDGDLTVDKLKVRQGKKGDHVTLSVRMPAESTSQVLDMETAPLRVLLGDAVVFELPPAGQRSALVNTGFTTYRYRDGRRGPKLVLDLSAGRVKLNAQRLDLDEALASTAAGLGIRLEFGTRSFETVVDMKRRRRVLKMIRPVEPVLPPGQDPGIDITFTAREIEAGWFSGIEEQEFAVARNTAEWQALWDRHAGQNIPSPTLPDVDFTEDMVVGVFLGNRPDPSHAVEIRRIRSGEAGLLFEYDDARVVDANCAFPAVVAQPFFLVKVPHYDTVLFKSRIVKRKCEDQ